MEPKLLSDKKCIVVGASRGTGLEIARNLALNGADLVLTEIPDRINDLEMRTQELADEFKIKADCYSLDVTNIESIKTVFTKIKEKWKVLDTLINNAGINILCPAVEVTEMIWDRIVDINLKGLFFVMQEAAKIMITNGKGVIVSIASQHGVVGNKDRAPYCASKAGLINLSKALAYEWAKYDIRVNTVSPSFIETEQNEEFLQAPNCKREYLKKIPLQRYCSPKDVANAVSYLVSDNAQMITGHNLMVDGGWTAI